MCALLFMNEPRSLILMLLLSMPRTNLHKYIEPLLDWFRTRTGIWSICYVTFQMLKTIVEYPSQASNSRVSVLTTPFRHDPFSPKALVDLRPWGLQIHQRWYQEQSGNTCHGLALYSAHAILQMYRTVQGSTLDLESGQKPSAKPGSAWSQEYSDLSAFCPFGHASRYGGLELVPFLAPLWPVDHSLMTLEAVETRRAAGRVDQHPL